MRWYNISKFLRHIHLLRQITQPESEILKNVNETRTNLSRKLRHKFEICLVDIWKSDNHQQLQSRGFAKKKKRGTKRGVQTPNSLFFSTIRTHCSCHVSIYSKSPFFLRLIHTKSLWEFFTGNIKERQEMLQLNFISNSSSCMMLFAKKL